MIDLGPPSLQDTGPTAAILPRVGSRFGPTHGFETDHIGAGDATGTAADPLEAIGDLSWSRLTALAGAVETAGNALAWDDEAWADHQTLFDGVSVGHGDVGSELAAELEQAPPRRSGAESELAARASDMASGARQSVRDLNETVRSNAAGSAAESGTSISSSPDAALLGAAAADPVADGIAVPTGGRVTWVPAVLNADRAAIVDGRSSNAQQSGDAAPAQRSGPTSPVSVPEEDEHKTVFETQQASLENTVFPQLRADDVSGGEARHNTEQPVAPQGPAGFAIVDRWADWRPPMPAVSAVAGQDVHLDAANRADAEPVPPRKPASSIETASSVLTSAAALPTSQIPDGRPDEAAVQIRSATNEADLSPESLTAPQAYVAPRGARPLARSESSYSPAPVSLRDGTAAQEDAGFSSLHEPLRPAQPDVPGPLAAGATLTDQMQGTTPDGMDGEQPSALSPSPYIPTSPGTYVEAVRQGKPDVPLLQDAGPAVERSEVFPASIDTMSAEQPWATGPIAVEQPAISVIPSLTTTPPRSAESSASDPSNTLAFAPTSRSDPLMTPAPSSSDPAQQPAAGTPAPGQLTPSSLTPAMRASADGPFASDPTVGPPERVGELRLSLEPAEPQSVNRQWPAETSTGSYSNIPKGSHSIGNEPRETPLHREWQASFEISSEMGIPIVAPDAIGSPTATTPIASAVRPPHPANARSLSARHRERDEAIGAPTFSAQGLTVDATSDAMSIADAAGRTPSEGHREPQEALRVRPLFRAVASAPPLRAKDQAAAPSSQRGTAVRALAQTEMQAATVPRAPAARSSTQDAPVDRDSKHTSAEASIRSMPPDLSDHASLVAPADGWLASVNQPPDTSSRAQSSDIAVSEKRYVVSPPAISQVSAAPATASDAEHLPALPASMSAVQEKGAAVRESLISAEQQADAHFDIDPGPPPSQAALTAGSIMPRVPDRAASPAGPATRRREAEQAPIRLSIGRITVDTSAEAAPARPFRRPAPMLSLGSYLDRRRRSQ